MATRYEDILRTVESLSRPEQVRLMAELSAYLKAHTDGRASILRIQGLGKDIWEGLDAQEYVDRERASWNG